MNWLITLAGAGLVMVILRDLFHTLWHPTRHGGLSKWVMTVVWRLSARFSRRRVTGLAGPLGMVSVVALWTFTMAVGWALIYWPHMPDSFSFTAALEPDEHTGILDAVYMSMVTMATLGFGDIAPASGWLRILAPMEALVGFALLTATVSWVLGIYPALARRRALALRLSHLRRADPTAHDLDSATGAALLESLANDIARTSVDFIQHAECYYFHDGDERTSLALNVDYARRLADLCSRAERADVRLCATVLATALGDLADILDARFLGTRDPDWPTFSAYASDHGGRQDR
ncbi:potassium channel family protein [Streptomyces sp. GC420]|uniref:potassium channel family protein n=1 Tax=Streptomyces sp. GC420 TaxID=2697568 RepID=UPI00141503D9|nr:potassium channel family protein [Streptomyces sp. GC420]NBM14513.1 two pore domain potassium channel family protein [Streptomyces sp. GC420]